MAGGFEVRSILRDGPATKGQTPLAVGDVIVAVNGEAVKPTMSIEECLRGTVGRETVVRVKRVPAAGGDVTFIQDVDSSTYAAFGQATYPFTDNLSLTARRMNGYGESGGAS